MQIKTNKRYLVTGGNRGIGLELVKGLLAQNIAVDVWCRQSSAELQALPVTIVESVELTDIQSMQTAQAQVAQHRYEGIICNAGLLSNETLQDFDKAAYERVLEQFKINSLAPLYCVSLLKDQVLPGAKIVLITSRMGSVADNTSGSRYGYRMSKAALNMAAKSLAQDLPEQQVILLHPGYVKTGMTGFTGNCSPAESAQQLLQQIFTLPPESSGQFFHANGEELPW